MGPSGCPRAILWTWFGLGLVVLLALAAPAVRAVRARAAGPRTVAAGEVADGRVASGSWVRVDGLETEVYRVYTALGTKGRAAGAAMTNAKEHHLVCPADDPCVATAAQVQKVGELLIKAETMPQRAALEQACRRVLAVDAQKITLPNEGLGPQYRAAVATYNQQVKRYNAAAQLDQRRVAMFNRLLKSFQPRRAWAVSRAAAGSLPAATPARPATPAGTKRDRPTVTGPAIPPVFGNRTQAIQYNRKQVRAEQQRLRREAAAREADRKELATRTAEVKLTLAALPRPVTVTGVVATAPATVAQEFTKLGAPAPQWVVDTTRRPSVVLTVLWAMLAGATAFCGLILLLWRPQSVA